MKQFFLMVSLAILISCNETGEKVLGVKEYFDLDSLLDRQIVLLAEANQQMNKQVVLDGVQENAVFDPDTTRLRGEFKIFREFDLNKTNYVGAYEENTSGNKVRYELKPDQKSPVRFLEIETSNDEIRQIEGLFLEDKEIYQHRREIKISFSEGLISAYSIRGFQDMVMKDTVHFQTDVRFQ